MKHDDHLKGSDVIPPHAKRFTNYDMLGYGGPVDELVRRVIALVNQKIAPAVIDERFHRWEPERALQFRGRWGTFRFSFLLADTMLDRGLDAGGPNWLAYEMENLAGNAINNALHDLVVAELTKLVGTTLDGLKAENRQLFDRIAALETRWWRRLWSGAKRLDSHLNLWLCRNGIWQTKEEGGFFAEARVAPLRYWFRGRAPHWGTR